MVRSKNFGLIGAAGYIAPRHMRAISETGNNLSCALDPHDSVGILDSFFPKARFFTEFERFDRFVDLRMRGDTKKRIHFMSIASPNYLHDAHIRFALRSGLDAICEKPIVLNPWNIDSLLEIEKATQNRINCILQLRLHPSILNLKQKLNQNKNNDTKLDVEITYVTSRGQWYNQSWKGNIDKSGGLVTNIGVHFFDMLYFLFGPCQSRILHHSETKSAAGLLEYSKARVKWFLSVNASDLPKKALEENKFTYRSVTINGSEVEFSTGFTDLHTKSYEHIIADKGFSIEECRDAVETVSEIRNASPIGKIGEYHWMLNENN